MTRYFQAYGTLAGLLVLSVGFVAVAFGANWAMRPNRPSAAKLTTYESGMNPIGSAWSQTQIRYYVFAFLFVIFDVESLPVPLGDRVPESGRGRVLGDGGVHRRARRRPAVRLPEGCPEMGLVDSVELPQPIKFVFNWGRKYSLWVFNFGLACCAIEFIATSMARHDFIRLGVIPFAHGPRQADLLVVSGTLTDKMAPALQRLYDEMPEPKYVISFGSCSNCGGPYWDSYSVTKGVDQIIPVDVYVPGCPPRPEALLHGIIKLQERIGTESLKERYARDELQPIVVGSEAEAGVAGAGVALNGR